MLLRGLFFSRIKEIIIRNRSINYTSLCSICIVPTPRIQLLQVKWHYVYIFYDFLNRWFESKKYKKNNTRN